MANSIWRKVFKKSLNFGETWYLWVFRVSNNKAEVRFQQIKITDLIWQTNFGKVLGF